MAIKLGDKVRDTVTGLEGIVTGITNWISGCTVMTVQPQQLKDGKAVESSAFDEPRLELVREKATDSFPSNKGGSPSVPSRGNPEVTR